MNKNAKLKILYAVFATSILMMIIFGGWLGSVIHSNRQGQEFYAALSVSVPVDVYVPIDIYVPMVFEPEFEPAMDFDAMRENFPSVVAWIQSEGVINYPIVQASDNYFYLNHLPDQSPHKWGSIFLDYRNAADFSDSNILIYGHNMRSGDMFGSLKNYKSQNYFEQFPKMFIFTPQNNFVVEIFAGYVLDSAFEVPPLNFSNETHFENFIADIRGRSFFQSNAEINFGDTIIFLCTCTDGGSVNERLIIAGRIL
jgi:sortase B